MKTRAKYEQAMRMQVPTNTHPRARTHARTYQVQDIRERGEVLAPQRQQADGHFHGQD